MQRKTKMITSTDFKRLSSILEEATLEDESVALLEEKLAESVIIESHATPPDLVTMNSMLRGVVKNGQADAGDVRVLTLVYPRSSDISDGRISIMAPLGVELLGARLGDVIAWRTREGAARKLVVDQILYQPERAGDLHL